MLEYPLVIHSVRKRIGNLLVLAGVEARLPRGKITAFIGPNGAGKTTLFQTITGELRPDGGRIVFEGRNITALPSWEIASRGVGKVFQDVRVFPGLSVIDNVIAALQRPRHRTVWWGLLKADDLQAQTQWRGEAESLLNMVGVDGNWDAPARELSWGNQKLLAFARLVAGRHTLVLLDEPAAGVSPTMVERLQELIRRLVRERGMTVALIEHDMEFVGDLADTVYVLKEGTVFDHGRPKDVLERPETQQLFLGL